MEASTVYYTDFRCPVGTSLTEKLRRLCIAAGIKSIDMDGKFVAIKMHFGELGNLAFLRPNYAKVVAALCKECGLTLTGAGSAYPYHKGPEDSHLRIAPTYPSLDEVETASDLRCVCVKLAVIEKLLAEKAE